MPANLEGEELEQGSEEWLRIRAGHATASRFSDVLAKIKTGEAASRRNYRTQLVTERLTGLPVETYTNTAMQWGNDHEAEAIVALEERTGFLGERVGFVTHPFVEWAGCSPDALIGPLGLAQVKCPYVSTNHIETLERGVPPEYVAQLQGEMWVTGRDWSLYVSYDPRMPENLRLYIQKVLRDDVYIASLEIEVKAFLIEIAEKVAKLKAWNQPWLKEAARTDIPINTAKPVPTK
jgi:predicted phage-related endonuclease